MNEAERCDRMSMMHPGQGAGRRARRRNSSRNARRRTWKMRSSAISKRQRDVRAPAVTRGGLSGNPSTSEAAPTTAMSDASAFSLRRLVACTIRETLELLRDPIRHRLRRVRHDVSDAGVRLWHLDRRQLADLRCPRSRPQPRKPRLFRRTARLLLLCRKTAARRLCRSRRSGLPMGQIDAGIEIPPGFGRDIARGRPAWVAAWIDGARPFIAQTIRGYLQAMHQLYLSDPIVMTTAAATAAAGRYRGPASGTIRISTASTRWCRRSWRWSSALFPGDPDGARRGPRKGARFDHQPVRYSGEPSPNF